MKRATGGQTWSWQDSFLRPRETPSERFVQITNAGTKPPSGNPPEPIPDTPLSVGHS
jgi:hypothetical protein